MSQRLFFGVSLQPSILSISHQNSLVTSCTLPRDCRRLSMHALWALLRQCVKARTFAPFDLMKGLTYRHAGIQATYLYRGYRELPLHYAVEKAPTGGRCLLTSAAALVPTTDLYHDTANGVGSNPTRVLCCGARCLQCVRGLRERGVSGIFGPWLWYNTR